MPIQWDAHSVGCEGVVLVEIAYYIWQYRQLIIAANINSIHIYIIHYTVY